MFCNDRQLIGYRTSKTKDIREEMALVRKNRRKRILAALLALSLLGSGLQASEKIQQVNAQEVNSENVAESSGEERGMILSQEPAASGNFPEEEGSGEEVQPSGGEASGEEMQPSGGEASGEEGESSGEEASIEEGQLTEEKASAKEEQTAEGEEQQEETTKEEQQEEVQETAKDEQQNTGQTEAQEALQPEETLPATAEEQKTEETSASQRSYTSTTLSGTSAEEIQDRIALSEEIWVEGFLQEAESLTYTGSEITQQLRIYHNGILLKEKLDYTLTYRNNVAAGDYTSLNAPSVTITMKRKYSGSRTLYYTIAPRQLSDCQPLKQEQTMDYQTELEFLAPTIYLENRRLVEGRDFTCSYDELLEKLEADLESNSDAGLYEYTYTVTGKGNFTGSLTLEMTILMDEKLNFANAAIAFDWTSYEYRGTALTTADVGILFVRLGGKTLSAELYEYQVKAENAGTGTVEIYPSEAGKEIGLRGRKILKIKVVGDREIKDTLPGEHWQPSLTFSGKLIEEAGGIFQSTEGLLVYGEGGSRETLTEGLDYSVSYQNHKKVGKATVTFTGMGRYRGTITRTFTIVPNRDLEVSWKHTNAAKEPIVAYMKNGAIPQFELLEASREGEAYILEERTDYSVRLTNNKKPGKMTCEIIGRGNYAGYYHVAEIEVVKGEIAQGTIEVNDRLYSEKPGEWKAPVRITDLNGKKLREGTDFILTYSYPGMPEETQSEGADEVYGQTAAVPGQGTQVTVTITGINYYEGQATATYRIYGIDISSLTIRIDPQEYTGKVIELSQEDIHVYENKADAEKGEELTGAYGNSYEIVGYENNVNVGLARVILNGKGSYGGTRTCFFRIHPAEYSTPRVTGISLKETTLYLGAGNSYRLTASIEPADAINRRIIWTTSDAQVAEVAQDGTITAKKAGKATITAISQDTRVTASCRVTVAIIPVSSFTLNTMEIEGEAGEEYSLEITEVLPENASDKSIQWESSNSQIAAVDAKGRVALRQPGMAVVTATANSSGVVRKCLVIVTGKEAAGLPDSYVRPQDFGAAENDETDDTSAFNQAIESLAEDRNTLYVPAGTYKINALTNIRLKSNMNLIMEQGAILEAIGNSSGGYTILCGNQVSNVTIFGGKLIGERNIHSGSTGEWGMGIGLYDSCNINIIGVEISDCWGDGIYLGSYNEAAVNAGCSQINIRDCRLFNNRRNNLSIVSADYVIVNGCSFTDARGTDPQYGIDIETNNSANPCEHILISDSTFSGNAMGSMGIITPANDITISGCTLNGDFFNYAGSNVTILDSMINGEVNARIPVPLEGTTRLNDYHGADGSHNPEDTLVASFSPATKKYTVEGYRIDSSNAMLKSIITDPESPSGQVLRLERMSTGNSEAGYYLKLSELMGGTAVLEAGATYRFEYTVKGSGQWGFRSSQTGWYPIVPMEDKYATGIVTYQAGSAGSCKIYLYAVSMAKGSHLEIDSLKIYRVN